MLANNAHFGIFAQLIDNAKRFQFSIVELIHNNNNKIVEQTTTTKL